MDSSPYPANALSEQHSATLLGIELFTLVTYAVVGRVMNAGMLQQDGVQLRVYGRIYEPALGLLAVLSTKLRRVFVKRKLTRTGFFLPSFISCSPFIPLFCLYLSINLYIYIYNPSI